jgi:hypothetical protein
MVNKQKNKPPAHHMSSDSESEESASGCEVNFSGDEEELSWEGDRGVKRFKIKFGRYRGKRLAQMITTKKRRNYLKYLLGWDKLRQETKGPILVALAHYDILKTTERTCSKVTSASAEAPAETSPAKRKAHVHVDLEKNKQTGDDREASIAIKKRKQTNRTGSGKDEIEEGNGKEGSDGSERED